jgi:hypothetical protein
VKKLGKNEGKSKQIMTKQRMEERQKEQFVVIIIIISYHHPYIPETNHVPM